MKEKIDDGGPVRRVWTIEKARERSKGFVLTNDKNLLLSDLEEHFFAKGFVEGYESAMIAEGKKK